MAIYRMYALLLTPVLLAAALFAPPCLSESPEAPRSYEIEVLVFQNLVRNDGGEIWPIDYAEWIDESDEHLTRNSSATQAITWLPEKAYRLIAERNALGRSSQYRPLAYFAWRQHALDRAQAVSMELPVRDNITGKAYVDGSVRVAVERYLHLYLDLQLHTRMGDEFSEYGNPEFRLTEHRRMRSRETHYFDNPRFGAITLITPYAPPSQQPAPADPQTGQP